MDVRDRDLRESRHQSRHRARQPGRETTSRRRLRLQQYRHIELLHAVLDDAGRAQGQEGLLHRRRLRRQHRLAHRARSHGHRGQGSALARHQGVRAGGTRRRQCGDPAVRLDGGDKETCPDGSRTTRRPPAARSISGRRSKRSAISTGRCATSAVLSRGARSPQSGPMRSSWGSRASWCRSTSPESPASGMTRPCRSRRCPR